MVEQPHDREIHIFCRSARRSHYATRNLVRNGFNVRKISGGMFSRARHSLGELIY